MPPARAAEAFGGCRELDLGRLHPAVSVAVHPEHAVAVARLPVVAVVVFHVRVVTSEGLHEFLRRLPRVGVGILVGRTQAGEGLQRVVGQQFLDERRLAAGDDERPAVLPVEAVVRARLTAEDRHRHGRLLRGVDREERALPDPAGRILGIEAAARRPIRHGPEELLPHLPGRDVVGRETLRRPTLLLGHPEMSVGRDDESGGVVELERIVSPFRNPTRLANHRDLLSRGVEHPHDVRLGVANVESPVATDREAGRLAFK